MTEGLPGAATGVKDGVGLVDILQIGRRVVIITELGTENQRNFTGVVDGVEEGEGGLFVSLAHLRGAIWVDGTARVCPVEERDWRGFKP